MVTFSSSISLASGSACRKRAGHDQVGAHQAGLVRQAPGVGVEHGHDRQDAVGRAGADRLGHARPHGVQHRRAVRVQDALGVARGAAGVTEGGGLVLLELGVLVARALGGQQLLVVQLARQLGLGALAHDHEVLDGLELVGHLGQRLDQRGVHQHDLVLGVVGHVHQLLLEQADVQRVQHGAHGGHGHVGLQVLLGVPGVGGHAVAVAHAQLGQRGAQALGALGHLGVAGARGGTRVRPRPSRGFATARLAQRHHLGVGVDPLHAAQDVGRGQRELLHRPVKRQGSSSPRM